MRITFACPSCAASGSVDASSVGKQARCRACGHRFAIPGPEDPPETYAVEDLAAAGPAKAAMRPALESVYVAARGSEPTSHDAHRRRKGAAARPAPRPSGGDSSGAGLATWAVRIGAGLVVVLAAVALLAPGGVLLTGSSLILIGLLMILVGYGAGAYGAFREDWLYGLLYLAVPLYTAYYIVSRWDDLRPWFLGSTAGVALVLIGTQILRWAGVSP